MKTRAGERKDGVRRDWDQPWRLGDGAETLEWRPGAEGGERGVQRFPPRRIPRVPFLLHQQERVRVWTRWSPHVTHAAPGLLNVALDLGRRFLEHVHTRLLAETVRSLSRYCPDCPGLTPPRSDASFAGGDGSQRSARLCRRRRYWLPCCWPPWPAFSSPAQSCAKCG